VGSPLELPSGTVTFLFTDIEGSTRLVKQLRGGYARVLAEHNELLRVAFAANCGLVVDTQGDAFFVVFRRAQDAVEAAIAAQRSLQAHVWPQSVELRVRMGIHTGQSEPSGGRYHGLAVHRAARIAATAHGGQVLVSHTTRNLLDDEEEDSAGVSLRDLGEQRLKDLDRPVRLYQLVGEGLAAEFPALPETEPPPEERPAAPHAGRWRRNRLLAPVAALVAVSAVAAGVLLTRGDSGSAQTASVAADSVGVFDIRNGNLIAQTPVQTGPSAIAVGADSIWVANVDDDSVSRIDPQTNSSVDTIPVGNAPSGIAVGGGFVWVTNSLSGTVSQIDANTDTQVQRITVGNGPSGVAYGEGAVWVANSTDRTVTEINARTGKVVRRRIPVSAGADGIAVGDRAVWVTSESDGRLSRIDPRGGFVTEVFTVGRGARAVAVGPGAVWVANNLDGTVSRVDPSSKLGPVAIPVGAGPSGIAVAAGGKTVWVSSEIAGSLSQIDPAQDKVVRTKTTGGRRDDRKEDVRRREDIGTRPSRWQADHSHAPPRLVRRRVRLDRSGCRLDPHFLVGDDSDERRSRGVQARRRQRRDATGT
jgi:YVTN family beta-propeller protein